MRRTSIYLDEEQTACLDRLATQEGISRAQLIRRMIDQALTGGDTSQAADLAAIEGSFGAGRDTELGARGPDDRAAHLTRTWRGRH